MGVRSQIGVVNVFDAPFEVWSTRETTPEEAMELVKRGGLSLVEALHTRDELLEVVSDHREAAAYMLREHANNALENHVERALEESVEYKNLLAQMPARVPRALDSYQGEFSGHDAKAANDAINTHGVELAQGQVLFHGGKWPTSEESFATERPFSTSFCPQVALRNAEWRGKAYDAGRVDLMVVSVKNPSTKAFAYRREGTHGNEKEVVFASGATLTRIRETHIADFKVAKSDGLSRTLEKTVPGYLVEIEIS